LGGRGFFGPPLGTVRCVTSAGETPTRTAANGFITCNEAAAAVGLPPGSVRATITAG
jgi:hypothetical protein